ncbi:hypothetical protein, partial [Bartonella bovis]|uniref:hypothetical protein n=1 Tax=Bartonella bovis TaxID=155194 RepID=UPI0013048A5F
GTGSANLDRVTITGGGATGTGVVMEGTEMMTMNMVNISEVQTGIQVTSGNLTVNGGSMTGVQTGITMLGSGTLTVNNGARIEFTGEYGVKVGDRVTMASLTDVKITGTSGGTGKGVEVSIESSKTMTMAKVDISNVAMGVEVKRGILAMKGGSIGFTG